MLVFECSEEVMVGRLVERGKTSGRVDDKEETIRKRLITYKESELLQLLSTLRSWTKSKR